MTYREYYRRHLPHWQPVAATLFVTFRLAGSLPQPVIDSLRDVRESELQKTKRLADSARQRREEHADERRAFARWDSALDRSVAGPRWLADAAIATIVDEALYFRDAKLYELLAFCIMPNHVHLVCAPLPVGRSATPAHVGADPTISAAQVHSLSSILQSLKAHTAREANAVLGRHGAFWQEESYDHVVRDAEELERVVNYVTSNPVKAGLVASWQDWRWTYCKPEWHSGLRR